MGHETEGYRGIDGFLKLLDLSKFPQNNRIREYKLGNFLQTMIATVIEEENGAAKTADGAFSDSVLSHWPIEPDIVNLRIHGKAGVTPDNVYDFGLIADHENGDSTDKDRSSIVKDQGAVQTMAYVSDLIRVSKRATAILGKNVPLNGAGFPVALSPQRLGKGNPLRGACAINFARNSGAFLDDGSKTGQLSHFATFLNPATASGGKNEGGKGAGTTQVQGGGKGGGKGGGGGAEGEAGLRADAGIQFKAGIGRWADEQPPEKPKSPDGQTVKVKMYVDHDVVGNPDDSLDTATDANSNHKAVPKTVKKNVIHGWVKVPNKDG
jgi:hypothetical protein